MHFLMCNSSQIIELLINILILIQLFLPPQPNPVVELHEAFQTVLPHALFSILTLVLSLRPVLFFIHNIPHRPVDVPGFDFTVATYHVDTCYLNLCRLMSIVSVASCVMALLVVVIMRSSIVCLLTILLQLMPAVMVFLRV